MAIGTYILTITLNVNGLNTPTKRHRLAEWIQKQDPYICCLQETHFKPKDTYRLKVRGWDNIFHANGKQKKSGVLLLLLSHFSRVRLFATPCIAARQASLSVTNSRSSLKLTSIESVMPSSHLIFCRPLLLLPLIPPSIRVFSNESTLLMRWPKYWSFSFSIIPSKEHPGLISFRMDWLDLLAVQGTLKSLLQHHTSKSINSLALSLLHSPTLTSIHDY